MDAILGKVVSEWVAGRASNDDLLHALVVAKAITLSESRSCYVEEQSREHELAHVFLDDDRVLEVYQSGNFQFYNIKEE